MSDHLFIPYEEWVADLEAIKDLDQRKAFIRDTLREKDHLHIFGRYFFPHIIQGTDDVPECHLDLLYELSSPEDRGILFPRGFAKSTWEKIDTIHDFVYALEDLIVFIARTYTDAGMHFEAIKAELESNDLLRSVYGDIVPPDRLIGRKWTNKHIQATNGVSAIARGRQKGRGVNIRNRRPTKIIVDDAEDDDLVRSSEQRAKYHNWLYTVIFPSMNPRRGKIKVIGTAIHKQAEVVQFYNKHGGIFRKAVEDGKSIWPAMFPIEDLYVIRDGGVRSNGKHEEGIGTRAFNREYMNSPTDESEAKIKAEWIEQAEFTELPPDYAYDCTIYLDPQAGEKETSDEWALTTLMRQRRGAHRFVYRQAAGRSSQNDQAREIVREWLKHKRICRRVGVEKVLNQTAVYRTLVDWKAGKIDLNLKGVIEGDPEWINESDRNMPLIAHSPQGKDKIARLEVFEPDFERGEIHLRPEQEELKNQLGHPLETEHDDRMDSLVGALELSGREVKKSRDDSALSEERKKRYNKTITGNIMKKTF